jgi:hypothetical protein
MASTNDDDTLPIIGIELAPGDEPRAVEQLNGDLLLPAAARPVLEQALLLADEALPDECQLERQAIDDARRLLGLEKVDEDRERELAQMLLVRPM